MRCGIQCEAHAFICCNCISNAILVPRGGNRVAKKNVKWVPGTWYVPVILMYLVPGNGYVKVRALVILKLSYEYATIPAWVQERRICCMLPGTHACNEFSHPQTNLETNKAVSVHRCRLLTTINSRYLVEDKAVACLVLLYVRVTWCVIYRSRTRPKQIARGQDRSKARQVGRFLQLALACERNPKTRRQDAIISIQVCGT